MFSVCGTHSIASKFACRTFSWLLFSTFDPMFTHLP
jgi:hypothetical protein